MCSAIDNNRCFERALTCSRYSDSEYEYRHVQLPKAMLKIIPSEYHDKSKGTLKLLWEEEWRGMGITQVRTLEHGRFQQKLED